MLWMFLCIANCSYFLDSVSSLISLRLLTGLDTFFSLHNLFPPSYVFWVLVSSLSPALEDVLDIWWSLAMNKVVGVGGKLVRDWAHRLGLPLSGDFSGKTPVSVPFAFPFGLVTYRRVESSGLLPRCRRSCSQCFVSPMVGKGSGSVHSASHTTSNSLVFTVFSIVSPFITIREAPPTQYPPFSLLQSKSSRLAGRKEGLFPSDLKF